MHVLAYFPEEDSTAVVKIGRVSGELKEGSTCNVLWDNRKVYSAIFLYSGTHITLYKHCYIAPAHFMSLDRLEL